jgi:two-component sensor histidine kinase
VGEPPSVIEPQRLTCGSGGQSEWRAVCLFDGLRSSVAIVRETVTEFVVANGIAESHVTGIRLAVSEAVANAVVHAFRDRAEPGIEALTRVTRRSWSLVTTRERAPSLRPRLVVPLV